MKIIIEIKIANASDSFHVLSNPLALYVSVLPIITIQRTIIKKTIIQAVNLTFDKSLLTDIKRNTTPKSKFSAEIICQT